MKKLLSLFLCLCLALTCVSALADVTVTDMTGREVTIEGDVTRVVALTAADVEILYAIGAGDLLVGRGAYCDYPAEALEVTGVQSGYETNIEEIIALQPQVLVMSTMAQTEEQVQQLEAAGIRVIVSDAQDIAGVYTAITLLGDVTGHADEAAALVASMQETFARYTAAEKSGKTVYFEISPLQWGLWTAGSGTFMNELADMVGIDNVFADVTSWASVSEEQVIARDPSMIITTTTDYGTEPSPVAEILGRAGWEQLSAVVNGQVFQADNDSITRPGPRLADAAAWLYGLVWGTDAE